MSESSLPAPNVLPEHVRFIRGIARSLLFDEQEAEDAVQETLLRALEQPPKPGNVRGWLRVVVRNFALRKRREERRRKSRELKQVPPDHIASPEEVVARLEVQRRVLDAVRELPEPYRSTIVHRYLDELTREEIAERLGIPLETVRTRLKRALRLLRQRLGEGDESAAWIGALLPVLGLRYAGPPTAAVGGSAWMVAKLAAGMAVVGVGVFLHLSRLDGVESPRAGTAAARASVSPGTTDAAGGGAPRDTPGLAALFATGFVRDAAGAAVAGARVVDADGAETLAGVDGRFRVRGASTDGRARVTVQKEGYLPADAVLDALAAREREITLVRGAPVTVVVLDSLRNPVVGAGVTATHRDERGIAGLWWSKRSLPIGEATSDAAGLARIAAAPEGRLEIRVDDPRYAPWRSEVRVGGTASVRCEAVLTRGGVVRGRVIDGSGVPVPGARVYLASWPARATATLPDGSYELRGVAEGESRILAEAEGFGTGFFGASLGWGVPIPVQVAADRVVAGIDIVLGPAVVVSGRVVDEAGEPLPGVRVETVVGPCLGRPVRVTTGALGCFSAGPFATTDGRPIRLAFEREGYAIDPAKADLPSQTGRVDLGDVTARRCGSLRGHVVDLDGMPLACGRVEIVPGGRAALVAPDGTFEFDGLPPGPLHVHAHGFSPPRRSDPVPVTIEPGAAASGIEIRIEPMRSIRGRVESSHGRPRPGVAVGATPEGDDSSVLARAVTDRRGEFELAELPDGSYRVGILRAPIEEETASPDSRLPFTGEAISVRLFVPGLDDVEPPEEGTFASDPPAVRARTGEEQVTLVVRTPVTSVDGRVLSRATGLPLRTFEVSFIQYWKGLVPRGSETLEVQHPDGRFSYDLKEGSWAVEVSAPGYATFRTPVFDAGRRATHGLGAIRLGPGGSLRGAVQDAYGAPVSYARLYLLGQQLQTNRRPIFTDASGGYEARAIAPGTYTVFVLSPRHPLGIVRNVEIGEDAASPLDVRLGRPSPVTVVVTDDAGLPVAGAEVSYTCDALLPLTSRVLRSHEPPGWGGFRTDAEGRLFKPCFPATRVHFRVKAPGFVRAARTAELREDQETVVEIRLERER